MRKGSENKVPLIEHRVKTGLFTIFFGGSVFVHKTCLFLFVYNFFVYKNLVHKSGVNNYSQPLNALL